MSKSNSLIGSFDSSAEIKEPFFTFSKKTIRFNHGAVVYPVSNLTKIGMYEVEENKMPLFIIIILFIVAVGIGLHGWIIAEEKALTLFGIVPFSIAVYGAFERLKPGRFAFGIKTASGEERYIYSKDKKFISKVVTTLSDSLENSEEGEKYAINIKKASIDKIDATNIIDQSVKNKGVIGGSINTGN